MASNNPTSTSAVIGGRFVFRAGRSRAGALVAPLIMPALLVLFAGYLIVGIVAMRVPPGAAFPGPQFFPGLIAAGLVAFAVLLTLSAVRAWRTDAATAPVDEDAVTRASDDTAPRAVRVDVRSLAWIVVPFLLFALVLGIVGWVIAAALLFWCVARGFGSTRPLLSLVVGLTVSSLTYIAFDMLLGLSLPSGILGGGF